MKDNSLLRAFDKNARIFLQYKKNEGETTLQYTVKPLSPALAEAFLTYFDQLDFCHAPDWATCYCRFYHTGCSGAEWEKRPGEVNRAEALQEISNGNMKGYLAFDGEKCIGWCNANDVGAYVRLREGLVPYVQGKKAGCIVCYVIDPAYRNQGVARSLLKAAVEGFRRDGFEVALAMPVVGQADVQRYRGTFNMYRELGYVEIARDGNTVIMQLLL